MDTANTEYSLIDVSDQRQMKRLGLQSGNKLVATELATITSDP